MRKIAKLVVSVLLFGGMFHLCAAGLAMWFIKHGTEGLSFYQVFGFGALAALVCSGIANVVSSLLFDRGERYES